MAPLRLTSHWSRNLNAEHSSGHFQELWEHKKSTPTQGRATPAPCPGWSPRGMDEGDVVLFCPACKHLFLRDEAVVVSSPTAFVLGVGHTLIRTSGLVVVVGNLLSSLLLSGEKKAFHCHLEPFSVEILTLRLS